LSLDEISLDSEDEGSHYCDSLTQEGGEQEQKQESLSQRNQLQTKKTEDPTDDFTIFNDIDAIEMAIKRLEVTTANKI
jgi:hypothetical protein